MTSRTLYHFTAPMASHLGGILHHGRIWQAPSVALKYGDWPHPASAVVWLTDDPDPANHHWTMASPIKCLARVTVEIADAERWIDFAKQVACPKWWQRGMSEIAGHQEHRWWVVPRPVTADEWSNVEILEDDRWVSIAGAEPLDAGYEFRSEPVSTMWNSTRPLTDDEKERLLRKARIAARRCASAATHGVPELTTPENARISPHPVKVESCGLRFILPSSDKPADWSRADDSRNETDCVELVRPEHRIDAAQATLRQWLGTAAQAGSE